MPDGIVHCKCSTCVPHTAILHSSWDAVACRLFIGHQHCLGLEAIVTAQVLEDKLRALEHYLKEYQERRRLAVRSSPSSRHRMLHSGGYPDDPAQGDPPAKRQKLAEAAKLEDQRCCISPILFGSLRSRHSSPSGWRSL